MIVRESLASGSVLVLSGQAESIMGIVCTSRWEASFCEWPSPLMASKMLGTHDGVAMYHPTYFPCMDWTTALQGLSSNTR